MSKMISGLMATAIAASFAVASAAPVVAAPFVPKAPEAANVVLQVQYDGQWKRRPMHGDRYRGGANPRFERRGDAYYFNGHRGYRDYRPGYRRYNDFWFPAGAFVAGALIGSAIANQPTYAPPAYAAPAYGNNAHVQWCYDRYRSYRASDNTFQPYNGPRQQCRSPY